ncbi:hypothetical protein C8J57DRAFT_1508683 [Mycena rebaudengoi]|nr:hypothetical protein C8J57DRAFT_1508683 [Mycena rebaudengoi]
MFVHLRSYCVQALPFLNPVFGTSCAASFRHVHPFVFMLRSGSFPAHPYLPCVYAGVQVPLFLCPCAPVPCAPAPCIPALPCAIIPAPLHPVFLAPYIPAPPPYSCAHAPCIPAPPCALIPAPPCALIPAPPCALIPAPPCSLICVHAASRPLLFSFALRSGPPAQGPCAASFRHVHPFVFMLRSGSFPARPCSPCVYVGVWVLFLRPCAAPLRTFSRSPMFNPVFMLVFGTSCTGALCCLVSPCSLIRVHAAFGSFLFSFALRSGPPAQGPRLAFSRSPCVRDLLHRGLASPFPLRPAFGTSCTGALCGLVLLMLACIVFMLRSGLAFSRSPCVRDLLHRGLAPPFLVHSTLETSYTVPFSSHALVLLFASPFLNPELMTVFGFFSCASALCRRASHPMFMSRTVHTARMIQISTCAMFGCSRHPLPSSLRFTHHVQQLPLPQA